MREAGSDAELPATFGKYYLTEKLATGGLAEIYLAKLIGPNGFEKQLVIKQIHPRLSGQRQFVDLFVAEAKILVTLAHGNIVPVYELGVVDETYFIAMEYIDGPTLYRLTEALARRDAIMPPAVAAWIMARVLDGLDYAHRKGEGVIHRDLSPRNVMLSRDGEVKLVDFGIAVSRDGTLGAGEATAAVPTGSFPYMSPEQVRREALTAQTDLFTVGVLAWEMLVGQRLFARDAAEATLAAVEGAEIARPSAVNPEVPAKLDEVVMRALERDRGARWETAGDMHAALNRYLYALAETPGPREVAALVAKYCPPETRRMATHAEAMVLREADGTNDSGPLTTPSVAAESERAASGDGPHTAVLPRPAVDPVPPTPALPAPRGRRTRAPTRQQSFATHVALDELLERAPTPSTAEASTPPEPELVTTVAEAPAGPKLPVAQVRVREANDRPAYSGGPPGSGGIIVGALAAAALGGAAIYVFEHGRDAVMRPDAMPKYDAPYYAIFGEASIAAADASVIDAAPAADAPPPVTLDAGRRTAPPPVDGATRPDATAAAAAPTGTATLKIGADPWGEIQIDGVARGRTPLEVTVAAGHHTVEVIFGGDDSPRKKPFAIDVGAGEVRSLQADFRTP